jgi:hypothetical protein
MQFSFSRSGLGTLSARRQFESFQRARKVPATSLPSTTELRFDDRAAIGIGFLSSRGYFPT